MTDLTALARSIIDANAYMVLGTADATGQPWVTPVWFAHDGYREFIWVSSPDTRHSGNVAVRPVVSIVIFDSRAEVGTGNGVYISATAQALEAGEQDRAIEVFSRRSVEHGGRPWTVDDVAAPARLRLYRATGFAFAVLDPDAPTDVRVPVDL